MVEGREKTFHYTRCMYIRKLFCQFSLWSILRSPYDIKGQIPQNVIFLRKCDIISETTIGGSVREKLGRALTTNSESAQLVYFSTVGYFKIILFRKCQAAQGWCGSSVHGEFSGTILLNLMLVLEGARNGLFWFQTLQSPIHIWLSIMHLSPTKWLSSFQRDFFIIIARLVQQILPLVLDSLHGIWCCL